MVRYRLVNLAVHSSGKGMGLSTEVAGWAWEMHTFCSVGLD